MESLSEKTLTSIKSLKNWSDKILIEAGKKEWRVHHFIQDFNIKDFQRFYEELLPHIEKLATTDPELFSSLILKYKENGSNLKEAMKENYFTDIFWRHLFDLPMFGRKANNLIEAILQIKSNSENIEYSLKLIL